jgi:hypothetical protein
LALKSDPTPKSHCSPSLLHGHEVGNSATSTSHSSSTRESSQKPERNQHAHVLSHCRTNREDEEQDITSVVHRKTSIKFTQRSQIQRTERKSSRRRPRQQKFRGGGMRGEIQSRYLGRLGRTSMIPKACSYRLFNDHVPDGRLHRENSREEGDTKQNSDVQPLLLARPIR